ncbi:MAG TPA: permease-like cell division protein FtsX [Candidatus Saccharimonadales bacterium]|nr:permease-like cell division protein FtsX [Candidatus Saccharimonadales bacterium]
MRFVTTVRITKTGLHNFVRNAWLSTAATAVMTVTLTLVAVSYIANSALTQTIKGVVGKIDVSIYLNDADTPDQINALKAKIEQAPNVQGVKFISKADALAEYRKQNADNPKLLEAISEADNPLPASLQIKAKDPNKLEPITAIAGQSDVKPLLAPRDAVSYSGDRKATIDKIIQTSNFFKATGLVASIIFIVISTLIIFNTIRMAIFTRREEIEIMKLVGATSWFIRGPFIFEAALYGIIAAILALLFIYSVVLTGAPKLGNYVDTKSIVGFLQDHVALVTLIELLIGMLIGTVSSLFALKRYLKL